MVEYLPGYWRISSASFSTGSSAHYSTYSFQKTFVCLVAALASVAVAAPTDITQKNLGGVLPVTSGAANHQAGSFSNGAQQASSNAAQGSFGYDHAAQAAKAFGNKESSGSRENFAHSSSNAFNHGSGSSSHDSGFNNNAHLANLGHQQASTGSIGFGGVGLGVGGLGTSGLGTSGFGTGGFGTGLPVGAHSSLGSLQQGSSAAGASKGHNAWNVNQGQSSVKSTGNKESFSNKESFGQEASSSHAKGNGQNSQSQSAQQGHHNQGQQVSSANQGSSLLG